MTRSRSRDSAGAPSRHQGPSVLRRPHRFPVQLPPFCDKTAALPPFCVPSGLRTDEGDQRRARCSRSPTSRWYLHCLSQTGSRGRCRGKGSAETSAFNGPQCPHIKMRAMLLHGTGGIVSPSHTVSPNTSASECDLSRKQRPVRSENEVVRVGTSSDSGLLEINPRPSL